MRIMQINSSWGWSGGQNQVLTLSEGLDKKGHFVVIVTPENSELSRRAKARGLFVQEVYMKKEYNIGAVRKLKRLMKELKIDLANAHKPLPFSLGSPAAAMAKVPVFVVSRRVSFPIGRNALSAWKWRNYKIDGIISVSQQIKRGLVKFGYDSDMIEVIYSGTDIHRFHPGIEGQRIRAEFGASRDTKIITKLANYFDWKGYSVFLESAARIVKEEPFTLFLCVGNRTDYYPQMKEMARKLKIGDHVIFTGFRTDVPEIIAASDVTVNCALRGEGLAGVLRESLAMEVPVVSSDAGGNSELVDDHVTGRLVPKGDVEATTNAILELLHDPSSGLIMARRGRDRVMSEFTDEVMIEKTELFYRQLMDRYERKKGRPSR